MRDWKKWIKAAGIRAIRTFAQTALGMMTVGQAFVEINWGNIFSVSGVAAVISILTSLLGLPEVDDVEVDVDDEEAE